MLNKLKDLIKEAGEQLMYFYNYKYKNITIQYKNNGSPVTNIDSIVNKFIMQKLYDIKPNIPILSEECLPEISICKKWEQYWLIDPLDGTKEFLQGIPEFSINICLVKHANPVLGLIYIPFYKILYYSYLGISWKEVYENKKKIYINKSSSCKNTYTIAVSRYHNIIKKYQYMKNIKSYFTLKMGSSWKFGLIAEGKVSYYPRLGNTGIWDTAAGEVIIKSSGGKILDLFNKKLDYSLNNSFINNGFHAFI
ncbi:3'(2'),5'-bisphosphate nucleotidase CysQ [Buchnera aphidicola (Mollitrichosiphum nigrofasciatum)]|uniref:3'(2'),5'-bisphosphate nucleotidase CysQ n=1 Tax=Buchnera aphidicola TaxID=9 RepID=UPI0031B87780